MYVWSDTDKKFEGVRIIFTDTEKSNWAWDDVAEQYYWHRFFSHQPDLNFDNPRVMEEVLSAMRFWLDMGVDGLRLDAIPYLIERDGTSCENVPETHVIIKHIRAVIDAEYENRLILAEANMWPADVRPYFGDGDECHMAFHFPLMPRIYMALRQEDRLPITDIMAQTPPIPDNCQWGLFLRNHDELTLEMVTDDERDYMNLAYASDSRMRINVGIRRRLAPLMDNNRRRIELLNSLLLSFPGTPILYYGDEIGMGDNIYLGDRNGVRTPMQWNSDRNAGFSKAVPAQLYFPVIMDPVWGYQAINVEAQQTDPSSLLHWTRNMIALRKIFQVFGRGSLEFLHPDNRKVLAYVREYVSADGHTETVLCVANLSRFAQPVQLDLGKFAGRQPVEMLGYVPFPPVDGTPYALTLAPYSFFWLELQPAPAKAETAPEAGMETVAATPTLASLLAEAHLAEVEALLPAYIAKQRWFGGKSKKVREVRITSSTSVDDAVIAFLAVTYEDAATDQYQLPLAVAGGREAEVLRQSAPRAVIGTVQGCTLFDASASREFQAALLHRIIGPGSEAGQTTLAAGRSSTLDAAKLAGVPAKLGSAEQSNTSIFYGSTAVLKLFRHLRTGENPDVEMTRFLTDVAHFPHIPAYLGDLHRAGDLTTVAFLQAFAPNVGDGWAWTLDELGGFYAKVATLPAPASEDISGHSGYAAAAALIGQRTAGLHLALATPAGDAAFAAEPTSGQDLAEDRERLEQQSVAALNALQTTLQSAPDNLPAATAALAAELLENKDSLLARVHALVGGPETFGERIRIHGDYHLGQLLRTPDDGFLIVDFEGEPARTLEQRRQKQSPLRDVAGMLRSFSYAASSALSAYKEAHAGANPALDAWAAAWENAAAKAFLDAYRRTIAARPGLLPEPPQAEALLQGLLLEKALYELLYELNNRPAWLHIPLNGLLSIARRAS
jgi:maltose alpha-D-glucosyltransferase/alpha-amylase